ncbi:MAG: FAD-binding protein [Chlorobia bacterium]|nr:FAD-binding protein [Fimbriimonadaceae bacterium]
MAEMEKRLQNWAANLTYQASKVHAPDSVAQIQELVAVATKIRALGTRHSFSDLADTPDELISTAKLDRILTIDRGAMTATIEGGVTYGQLTSRLQAEGLAIHNLASLPHISVAGACATATHGSGDRNGNLATAVSAMQVVIANGETVEFSRAKDPDQFSGAVVHLGGLGIVTQMTLDIQPTFQVRQEVFQNVPIEAVDAHFYEITSSGYSVSLFTNLEKPSIDQVWVKSVGVGEPKKEFYGGTAATHHLHPLPDHSAVNCTDQMGIPGPWSERLAHFKLAFTPSSGEELQTEFLVPRHHALGAIQAVRGLKDRISPLLHISEIRTIAADELWMSPCYDQPCVGIHFTWRKNWESVRRLLPVIEDVLSPFHARPHWGKLTTMASRKVIALYERLPNFQTLLEKHDPQGKFRNDYLNRYVFGTEA